MTLLRRHYRKSEKKKNNELKGENHLTIKRDTDTDMGLCLVLIVLFLS